MKYANNNRSECCIPLELWLEIFPYLPFKSIIRFRSVSKSWKSAIEDPKLPSAHPKHCSNSPYLFSCETCCYGQHKFFLRYSQTYSKASEIELPTSVREVMRYPRWEFCNGAESLILLHENPITVDGKMALWNPSIKKVLYLPLPPVLSTQTPLFFFKVCLLFDAPNDDYKVVMIRNFCFDGGWEENAPLVDVYSLKGRSWRRVEDVNGSNVGLWAFIRIDGVCIRGCAHWLGGRSRDRGVVSFDVTSNMWSFTPFSGVRAFGYHQLLVLSDSILGLLEHSFPFVTIWAMERSSSTSSVFVGWTKRYRWNLVDPTSSFVAVQKCDVLLQLLSNSCQAYDLKTGEVKLLTSAYDYEECRPIHVNHYVESLFLLGA